MFPADQVAPDSVEVALCQTMASCLECLQGMPAPLPGCVWGLPMLPPIVPGMMPTMGMPPQPQMMMSQQQAHMPWVSPSPAYSAMLNGASPVVGSVAAAQVAGSSAAGIPAPVASGAAVQAPAAPCGSATGSDVVMSSPPVGPAKAGAAVAGAPTGAASAGTTPWSRGDASTATALNKVDWEAAEDGIVDDVFGLGASADDLHDFSDSLLQADGDGCSGGKGATAVEDGLSWMQDECLMDDLKPADERAPFLDVVA